jgi:hypothetical protein
MMVFVSYFSSYTVILLIGGKESAWLNNIQVAVNVSILVFMFFAGITKANAAYLRIQPNVILK